MPESMSIERRKMFALLGAETVLTPKEQRVQGAIDAAHKLLKEIPNSIMPWQFGNPANPAIHRRTTAEEIWADTGGEVDFIVSGIGTGGTLMGCAEALKPRRPALKFVAVEPKDSAVLSGGAAGPHAIQGIGAGFVPDILNVKLIDEIITITNQDAVATARKVARLDGIPVGISSGAIISAALQVAARPANQGKTVVCFAPSNAERYMSTLLFEGL
jgi:cysteine synthase A